MLSNSPRILKAGIVLMDPASGAIVRVIPLQYNPQSLSRSLQAQTAQAEGDADRSEALRLTGPPTETIKLDAILDATDKLEKPLSNQNTLQFGLQPELSALETIIYPSSARVQENARKIQQGAIEVTPIESALTLFVWGKSRIAPVRIIEFGIEEQFFDNDLNPIRAKISLGMKILNTDDLGFRHRGASIFMAYHREKERFASITSGALGALGLGRIPS